MTSDGCGRGAGQAPTLPPRLRIPPRRLTAAWQRTVEAERRAGRRRPPALRTAAAEPALRVRLWATAVCIVAGGGRLCGMEMRMEEEVESACKRTPFISSGFPPGGSLYHPRLGTYAA